MVAGLGPGAALLVAGRVYQFGPIQIRHDWETNKLLKVEELRTAPP